MKPFGNLLLTAVAGIGLVACDGSSGTVAAPADEVVAGEAVDIAPAGSQGGASSTSGTPLASGAPKFATLYPEAELSQPVVQANGADGPGGLAEFVTPATPDEVVAHYRKLAGDAGLKPVMSMNQGNARAFAALNNEGAEVQVVASPDETGATSVQLTWKSGR
ncbi:hypothetical protein [Brevundimonas sp. GN22]